MKVLRRIDSWITPNKIAMLQLALSVLQIYGLWVLYSNYDIMSSYFIYNIVTEFLVKFWFLLVPFLALSALLYLFQVSWAKQMMHYGLLIFLVYPIKDLWLAVFRLSMGGKFIYWGNFKISDIMIQLMGSTIAFCLFLYFAGKFAETNYFAVIAKKVKKYVSIMRSHPK